MARVAAAAQVLSRPATVRLNFNSDPAGATVSRADGTVLGLTPLSIEAPYGDAPTEYVFSKEGHLAKTVALVPNLPSPIFAVLQAELPGDPPPSASGAVALSAARAEAERPRKVRSSRRRVTARIAPDEDEVLAPTDP